jgi:hypothetical protein
VIILFSLHCIGRAHIFGQLESVSKERGFEEGIVLMTPKIREAIRLTKSGFVGLLDLMSTAVLDTTVSIAFNPAAFIVSPDSIFGQSSQSPGRVIRTHEINDAICNPQSTSSLHTPTQFDDLCP